MDGAPWSVSYIEPLDPGQSTTVTVEHAFDEPGMYTITGRAAVRDELPADDAAKLIVEVREKVAVLVIAPEGQAAADAEPVRYFLAALGKRREEAGASSASFFEPTLVEAGELESIELMAYQAIVLLDAPPVSEETVARMTRFVASGGGLWLALGEETEATAFNEAFGAGDAGLSPVMAGEAVSDQSPEGEFSSLHPPPVSHPATALLGDTARLDIREARLTRRWDLRPRTADEKLLVLLETGRGEPVAVERFVGRGRVIVQSIPLTRSWSNLALCKLFVPYVQEWLRYLVQPVGASHNLSINEPLVVRRPGTMEEVAAVLQAPLQSPVELSPEFEEDQLVYRYFGTTFPGDYTLTLGADDHPLPYVVRRNRT